MRKALAGLAGIAAALALGTAAQAAGTVKIGVVIPLSGQFADTGIQMRNGIQTYGAATRLQKWILRVGEARSFEAMRRHFSHQCVFREAKGSGQPPLVCWTADIPGRGRNVNKLSIVGEDTADRLGNPRTPIGGYRHSRQIHLHAAELLGRVGGIGFGQPVLPAIRKITIRLGGIC